MAKRFYEIFRAGNYPQGSFDADDIKQIADNYDPSFLEAPVTVDHQWGGPAYGWIEELKAEGERLLATFKDVSDHLKCMVATKAYKRHSVEIYNDIDDRGPYLKALSMLGANTPQVKGMEPIEFATFSENFPEDESETVEFDEPIEPGDMSLSELFNAWLGVLEMSAEDFREEYEFDQDGVVGIMEGRFDEEADGETLERFNHIMARFQEAEVSKEAAEAFTAALGFAFSEEEEPEDPPSEADEEPEDDPEEFEEPPETVPYEQFTQVQQQLEDLRGQLAKLSDKAEDADTYREEVTKLKFDQRKQQFVSFLDKQTGSGKLLPKMKDKALALFEHLEGVTPADEDQPSALQLFKEFIEGLPEIDLDEEALKKKQPKQFSSSKELADAATEYMEEQRKLGNHVGSAQAVTHVKNKLGN